MDFNEFKILFLLFLLNTKEGRAENEQPTKPDLLGTLRFRELSKCKYYIDKTEFIRHYLCGEKYMIINAPRRFGKTHNMDMLREFLEIKVNENGECKDDNSETKELFIKFKVFDDTKLVKEHLGQYPIIHIDMKNENIHSSECVLEGLRDALHLAYKQHGYLKKSKRLNESMKSEFNLYFDTKKHKQLGIDKVINGLTFLSLLLYTHFQKRVHVFVDEYDSPIRHAMYKSDIIVEDVAEIIFSMYFSGLDGNKKYVDRGFLTGITFNSAGFFIDCHRFGFLNDHYAKFYGATDSEVQELFRKTGVSKNKLLEAEEWYGGYTACMSATKIFNMGSIVNFCRDREAQSYWQSSGNADNLNGLFNVAKISIEMNKLILGHRINYQFTEIDLEDLNDFNELIRNSQFTWVQTDKVLTLLLEMGYLSYAMPVKESWFSLSKNYTLKLPNKETKAEFVNMVSDYYQLKCGFVWSKTILALNHFSATADRNVFAKFVPLFQSFVQTFIGKGNDNIIDEITFQSSLYVMLCQTKLRTGPEVIAKEQKKRGEIFVAMTQNKLLIIISLMYQGSAVEAFQQIESSLCDDSALSESKYRETNITDKIIVGLNIDQHFNVTMRYQINDCTSVVIP